MKPAAKPGICLRAAPALPILASAKGGVPVGYVLLVLEVLGSLIGDFVAVLATLPPVLWVAMGVLLTCGVVLIVLDRPEEG